LEVAVERMDAVRKLAGVLWVGLGLVGMVLWSAAGPRHPAGAVTWTVVAVVTAACVAQAASARVRWWAARAIGVTVGVLLLGAVADRFGAMGGPGAPGVSWGDWAHFRAEAAQLVPWESLVQPAAITATVAELTLGALMVAGPWWRWVGKATAGLFFAYLVAMIPGMGAASLLQYGIPVLIGGSLITSARGPRPRPDHTADHRIVPAATSP
jgi:hypothetical protein